MPARTAEAGDAVHAVLAVFSLGLLATSVLFDVWGLASRRPVWAEIAYQDLVTGLAGAAAAAVLALVAVARTGPASSARPTAVLRASAQISTLALFGGALILRRMERGPSPSTTALVLSAAGLALGALAAWLTLERSHRLQD
jgi:uncharacterized membrane protein